MGLLLPEAVIRNLRLERAQELAMAEADSVCVEFTRELRKIDVHLEMVYWPMRAPSVQGFMNGCYHIVRHNPDAAGSVEPLVDADGAYREPGSWVFDLLASSDMWDDRVMRDRATVRKRAEQARECAKAREREDRREELRDRANAAWRASVSMTDVPWTQAMDGRRGRRAVPK
jgi:hypothetical protein